MPIKNYDILYEDTHILVCYKYPGIATQTRSFSSADLTDLLKRHLSETAANNSKDTSHTEPYLAVIHRLDQPVGGILVFAKTPFAAKQLNAQLTKDGFGKHYLALVSQAPSSASGDLEDYLVKDAKSNTSHICTATTSGAKIAKLHYDIIENVNANTELHVQLETGRHHQIRVQLAEMGCPILGDRKYNPTPDDFPTICLCAYKLSFLHPKTNKQMNFEVEPYWHKKETLR